MRFIFMILALFFSLSLNAQNFEVHFQNDHEFELRKGLVFHKNENKPYSGKILSYSTKTHIKIIGEAKYGVPINQWEFRKDSVFQTFENKNEIEKIKRTSYEADRLAIARNNFVGYDWVDESETGAFKFNKNGEFNSSTSMFGGSTFYGTWEMKDENSIYLDYYDPYDNFDKLIYLNNKTFDIGQTRYSRQGTNNAETIEDSYREVEYKLELITKEVEVEKIISTLQYYFKYNEKGELLAYNEYDKLGSKNLARLYWKNGSIKSQIQNNKKMNWNEEGDLIKIECDNYSVEYLICQDILSFYTKEELEFRSGLYYLKQDGKISKNGLFKDWNIKGDLITDVRSNNKGLITSGFYTHFNSLGEFCKLEFKIENEGVYNIQESYYDKNGILWAFIERKSIPRDFEYDYSYADGYDSRNPKTKIQTYVSALKTYYPNGELKVDFKFCDSYTPGKTGLKFLGYEQTKKNLYTNKGNFYCFKGEQNIYYENGDIKYTLKYKHGLNTKWEGELALDEFKSDLKKVKPGKLDNNQNYLKLENWTGGFSDTPINRWYVFLGDGLKYDSKGEKAKILVDQFGRECDKNGNIIDNTFLNFDFSEVNDFWFK